MASLPLWLSLVLGPSQQPVTPQDVIAAIRVHGNQVTPEDEILRVSGLAVGQPFLASTLATVRQRLLDEGRFRSVEVLKRFASLEDPTQILIVLVVDDGPVALKPGTDPEVPLRIVRRRGLTNLMIVPLLDGQEGYGVTYGARVSWVDVGGRGGRISAPLTWGGWKLAGLEYERTFERGPVSRLQAGVAVQRHRHPAFGEDLRSSGGSFRVERKVGVLRLATLGAAERVRFLDRDERVRSLGVEIVLDTRLDPVFPRDAVYAIATVERYAIGATERLRRISLDARGYLGLVGQTVLVARATRDAADRPAPAYLQPMLGGWSNLRGFRAGAFVGDQLVAGSLELRVPVTSPLRRGSLGFSVFSDAGAVYGHGERLRDQTVHVGSGAGIWYTVTLVQLGVGVAHAHGGGTRATFGADLRF